MTRVLLTGASGFVGAHVLRHILDHTGWDVVCLVTFRHHGLPGRIASSICDHEDWVKRVDVIHCDLRSGVDSVTANMIGDVDYILNVASESHVDRSITEPGKFIRDNVAIMTGMLDYAREVKPRMFLQMSTDEVYGPAPADYSSREWDVILPSNPYSASKASQEAIAISYWRTYGVPVLLTNTMNIFGEMQDPEKFVPMIIKNLRDGKPITVHTDASGTPGSRFYLHARNLADAWLWLIDQEGHSWDLHAYSDGSARPSRFNIVGEQEIDNAKLVKMIADFMGKRPVMKKVDFHSSRPGHDHRYALDGSKISRIGWHPPVRMRDSLKKTVSWTLEHPEWLD
jgi:dTDP-glucose 4,6-dehydratase